jgi:hypothetical protein
MKKIMVKSFLGLSLGLVLSAAAHASFYYYNDTGSDVTVHYTDYVNYTCEYFTGYDYSESYYDTFNLAPGQSLTVNDYSSSGSGIYQEEHQFTLDYIE